VHTEETLSPYQKSLLLVLYHYAKERGFLSKKGFDGWNALSNEALKNLKNSEGSL
jgi:hypothetical protein